MRTSRIVITIFATAALIWFFNARSRPLETELQASFGEWHDQISKQYAPNEIPTGLSISLEVSGPTPGHWILPGLGGASGQDAKVKLRRILDMIRESAFFGLKPSSSDSSSLIKLTVSDPNRTFDLAVQIEEVEASIRAQNMIKLFELYASQVEPVSEPGRT